MDRKGGHARNPVLELFGLRLVGAHDEFAEAALAYAVGSPVAKANVTCNPSRPRHVFGLISGKETHLVHNYP